MRGRGEVQESEKKVEFPRGAFQDIVLAMTFPMYFLIFTVIFISTKCFSW